MLSLVIVSFFLCVQVLFYIYYNKDIKVIFIIKKKIDQIKGRNVHSYNFVMIKNTQTKRFWDIELAKIFDLRKTFVPENFQRPKFT